MSRTRFSTDGRIPAFNLQVLVDDRSSFSALLCSPVVRADLLKNIRVEKREPARRKSWMSKTMASLNAKVDLDKDPQVVAKDSLQQKGILIIAIHRRASAVAGPVSAIAAHNWM